MAAGETKISLSRIRILAAAPMNCRKCRNQFSATILAGSDLRRVNEEEGLRRVTECAFIPPARRTGCAAESKCMRASERPVGRLLGQLARARDGFRTGCKSRCPGSWISAIAHKAKTEGRGASSRHSESSCDVEVPPCPCQGERWKSNRLRGWLPRSGFRPDAISGRPPCYRKAPTSPKNCGRTSGSLPRIAPPCQRNRDTSEDNSLVRRM